MKATSLFLFFVKDKISKVGFAGQKVSLLLLKQTKNIFLTNFFQINLKKKEGKEGI